MTNHSKQFLSDFIREIWSEGRLDAVEKYLASTYTIYHDPNDPWNGQELDHAGFKNCVSISRAPFPDQQFTINEMVGEGDKIAVSWFWRGTHKGEIFGIAATGKEITMSGLTIYYFKNGKLSGHWQIADRASVYQQLTG
jgi:steroid delta-isomerase-like uncharacterized protein